MTPRRLIDTNLIVRHLVQDNARQAAIAGKLFEACDRGDVILVLLPVVLAECVFVLESFYGHPRGEIARALRGVASSPGIELEQRGIYLDALDRYARSQIHFVDCAVAASAAAQSVPVATFDADFGKFSDVEVKLD